MAAVDLTAPNPERTMSALPTVAADLAFFDKRAVADLMRCSTKHVDRMAKDGRMPPPVKLGRLCRWSRR
jgi:predicted DNA-binding transcriptional regulator AlpA